MKTFDHFLPTRVFFGNGEVTRVGKLTKEIGNCALVVTGRHAMRDTGILSRVLGYLEAEEMSMSVFDQISPNPKEDEIDAGVSLLHKYQCNVIIGMGGGSAMDAAKAIAAAVSYNKSIHELIDQDIATKRVTIPVITIPTTAGSGAEVTRRAIISDPIKRMKQGIQGNGIFPKIAIVDPELTLSLPKNITAETGFDVLCHAIETFVSKKSSPITMMFSEEAIRIVSTILPKLVQNGNNLDYRSKLMFASLLMGYNLANASTCLPHRLQYPIGGHTDTGHSAGLICLFPAWLQRLIPFAPQKLAHIAELMGTDISELSELEAAQKSIELVKALMNEIGITIRLRDLGISFKECAQLATEVTGNVEADISYHGPKDIIELYQAAW